jgi:hypothetical protein
MVSISTLQNSKYNLHSRFREWAQKDCQLEFQRYTTKRGRAEGAGVEEASAEADA